MIPSMLRLNLILALLFAFGCGGPEAAEAPAAADTEGDETAEAEPEEDEAKLADKAAGTNAAREAKMRAIEARKAAQGEEAGDDQAADQ